RDGCRWEHAGQPFFSGEVEPCINGRTVTLGTYFDQEVDGVVVRLLGEQLEDGGWNCEAENGSVRSSFATTINVLEGLLAHERATPLEAAARWHVAAGEHASRQSPPCTRGRRRSAKPVEHAARSARPRLVRAVCGLSPQLTFVGRSTSVRGPDVVLELEAAIP